MTNPDYTLIAVILDRSGSMEPIAAATIESFNGFIDAQRKLPGICDVGLVMFNGSVGNATWKLVGNVDRLTAETYRPDGGTALLDAIGTTIDSVGALLAGKSEDQRPGKVLIVIQTDGEENASRKYAGERIRQMIDHQRDTYAWQFLFLGASLDTFAVAASFGIAPQATMQYEPTSGGIKHSMTRMSAVATSYRATGQAVSFDAEKENAP